MEVFNAFLGNRIIIEAAYTVIVVLCSLFVYYKSKQIYDLSGYKGIRYFMQAFLLFALGFVTRFFNVSSEHYGFPSWASDMMIPIMLYYLISAAGIMMVYSLVWKSFEGSGRTFVLHLLALALAILEVFYIRNIFFISQIAVIAFGVVVSHSKYAEKKKGFIQLYFITLVLALTGYAFNYIEAIIRPIYPSFILYTFAVTLGVFFLMVFTVIKSTQNGKKKRTS